MHTIPLQPVQRKIGSLLLASVLALSTACGPSASVSPEPTVLPVPPPRIRASELAEQQPEEATSPEPNLSETELFTELPILSNDGSSNGSSEATEPSSIRTSLTAQRLAKDQATLSAQEAGWESEAFAESAASQLKKLASALQDKSLLSNDAKFSTEISSLITPDFRAVPLRPLKLNEVYQDAMLVVRRGVISEGGEDLRGVKGLRSAIRQLGGTSPSATESTNQAVEAHFKIIGIRLSKEQVETTVLVELTNQEGDTSRQMNATWLCHWTHAVDSPKLMSIRVTAYEESEITIEGGKWFTDQTSAVLGKNPSYRHQLSYGHHHWLQRVERVQRFDTSVRNGLAIGDANGDGLDDLFLCQPPGLPNKLFIRQADGTATDQSESAGIDWLDQTSAALFCDLDNDGDQDLVLGMPVGIVLMENDSSGHFTKRQQLPADYDVQSLSTVDYDNDGYLDIFACVYRASMPDTKQQFLYRDGRGGGLNRLFHNTIAAGNWTFKDVTKATGLENGGDRFSLAAAWEDFDRDGDQDLYIANDFGRNYLYENQKGLFVDIAEQAGVTDIGSGMSVSWGDFNRDGWPDLYVGNMFSSAGQRVTTQPSFRPDEGEGVRGEYQRLAKGNSLFLNQQNKTFREVGKVAGVERGRWAWSSLFIDLNNDGWEDLLVANGYMTTEDTGDL
ncbi:MAG: VCBS repeat-containing protein [Pirellulaceae bacterium]|nr:VCBS repeat-containing protein [Pirellulaceae bacterium]